MIDRPITPDDAISGCVAELRAAYAVQSPPAQAARCTFRAKVEPLGPFDFAVAITPTGLPGDSWALQVVMTQPSGVTTQSLTCRPYADVVEYLSRPELESELAAAVRGLVETDFHTDGLPERW